MYKLEFYKKYGRGYHPRKKTQYDAPLTAKTIKEIFADCSDLESRELYIGGRRHGEATVFFIDGLVSGSEVSDAVVRPLTAQSRLGETKSAGEVVDLLMHGAVWSAAVKQRRTADEVVSDLVNGYCVIVFDGISTAVSYETRTSNQRSITEPVNEKVLKGARDSFVETLRVNTSLLRRHMRNPALKLKSSVVGRKTLTHVAVAYVDGVAEPRLVEEVMGRLDAIDIEGLIMASQLEEYISDCPASPFPQLMHTERPDRFALNLLEGRVGILIDGLPIGYLVPGTLPQMLKVPEDKSHHFLIASFYTLLRYSALIMSVLLPATYVAIAMYHQEMIPTKLLLSTIASKQQVPFSTAIEVIAMLTAFELLQEAGLRLPDPVGNTVSIIGALVVGQSAIEAKVISPIAVIVVALSGIAGYTIPNQDLSAVVRLCRLLLTLAAIISGIFGLMLVCILILYHLCTLDSFGLPYLSPLATRGSLSAILRPPLWWTKYRDRELNTPDKRNQA